MREAYEKALRRGERAFHRALSSGHYPFLPDLDHILEGMTGKKECSVGTMEIPLQMIAGTKTRARGESFACDYMPVLEGGSEFAMKWSALYETQQTEGIRDPVKVYEYLHRFYVAEGNKRVSVLRFLGASVIRAEVTRILPPESEDPEIQLYQEFLEFFEKAPLYELQFSQKGAWRQLEKLLGMENVTVWPEEKVRQVKSAFSRFREAYGKREQSFMSASDALLVFLTFYPVETLRDQSVTFIDRLIGRIETEFRPRDPEQEAFFQKVPDPSEKRGLKKVLSPKTLYTEKHPLKIAFIHEALAADSGWVRAHERGRRHIEQQMDGLVSCLSFEGCSSVEKLAEATEEAAAAGCHLVITTSQLHLADTLKASARYPDVQFLNCSVNAARHSMRTYYGRLYEAKFIMGLLAGIVNRDHRIGYVADYPLQGNVCNINAFALGAAMTDPEAVIILSWTGDAENDWRKEIREQNLSVISGPDVNRTHEFDRLFGLFCLNEDGSTDNLAMPVCDWGRYYEFIVRSFLQGTWSGRAPDGKGQPVNYWWGIDSGVIDVILSEKLPRETRRLLKIMLEGLREGRITPFSGELKDRQGRIRLKEGDTMESGQIISMNWLARNVEGEILPYERLTARGKEFLRANGVTI